MTKDKDVVIVSAKRTPIGSFQGVFSNIPAHKLGSLVIESIIEETKIDPKSIDEVIMGNVLSAGQGQAPARQAALGSGLPNSVECLTINKMCGSGLKAVMLASQAIQAGDAEIIIAGGMENMTQAPYLLSKARSGYRLGNGKLLDSIIKDGLWDAYNDKHMGTCAEMCVAQNNFSREDLDAFAKISYERAIAAQDKNLFFEEMVPVTISSGKNDSQIIKNDEEPSRVNFQKIPLLKPAFDKKGTITAANASKINDGASALMLMRRDKANLLGLKPLVSINAQASAAHEPEWFTTTPLKAIANVLKKANLNSENIDLWEINEAFGPVVMTAIKEYKIDHDRVNVNGGAIALGHPIGCSGARILTTLIYAMIKKDVHNGLATLCIGGGEASAIIVRR